MKWVTRVELLIITLILGISLVLRLAGIGTYIVSDEMRWVCRSLRFRYALVHGDWASTFRIGHPGVVTTWLGTIFLSRDDTAAIAACMPDATDFADIGATPQERTQLMTNLGKILPGGRVGVAVFTWLCLIGIYCLTRRLWGPKIALLSLALLALDPFYLALSRVLHTDAVLTGLMTMSILSLLIFARRSGTRNWMWLVLSGIFGGLAILQKTPSAFLVPFVTLLLALDVLRQGLSRRRVLITSRDLIVWGLVAVVVYVALWPAMWVDPVGTIAKVLDKSLGYAVEGHAPGNYFLGHPTEDPGWLFYPVAIPFRLSPLVSVGLIVGLVWLVRERARIKDHFDLIILLLYSVLFGVFMTLGNKMFDRYLLPVFPSLMIVASAGIWWLAEVGLAWARSRTGRAFSFAWSAICLIALVVQVGLALPHYPYYLAYYNPLLGGIQQAEKTLLIGWGEGYDLAAAYMNAKPDADELQLAMPSFTIFSPQFHGDTTPMLDYTVWETDYVLFYISHAKRLRYETLLTEYWLNPERQPEYVVSLKGVEYIWLYYNDHHVPPMEYLEAHSQPGAGECLVVDGNSLFAKHYAGDLPVHYVYVRPHPEKEGRIYWSLEEMDELLDSLPPDCWRVWYLRYPEHEKGEYVQMLDSRGVLLDEAVFPHLELTLHRLVEPELVRQPTDVRFGDLRLQSYSLTDPRPAWGRDGGIVLEWEALDTLTEDYSVFLHLYDAHGHRIAQGDSRMINRLLRPTSYWTPGVPVSTLYHLPISPATPPGEYELEFGVYLRRTGKRLPLYDANGATEETSARIKIEIASSDQFPTVADLNLSPPVEQDLNAPLELLGYELEHTGLLAGQDISLRLGWQALEAMAQDYRLQLELQGADGTVYSQSVFDLVSTRYPTSQWQPGEALCDWYYPPTSTEMPTGNATLMLNLLDAEGKPVLDQPVEITKVWIQSLEPSFEVPTDIQEPHEVNLDGQVALLGYDLDSTPVRPGKDLSVIVYWQAQQEMEANYKVFVHLYDETGQVVAQQDRLPGLGARPTVMWESGEVLADRYVLPLSPDTPAGIYQLAIGMYDAETGERLAAYGADGGRLDQDRIVLGQVEVGP